MFWLLDGVGLAFKLSGVSFETSEVTRPGTKSNSLAGSGSGL